MRPISPISYISNRKETLNSPNSLIQQMEGKLNCSVYVHYLKYNDHFLNSIEMN